MGLTMSQGRAVTKTIATRYKRADKTTKGAILDELCAMTGWHRNHARKALAAALRPKLVKPARKPRAPTYDADTVVALRFCWAVLGAPTGKRLAPMMGELVPRLRRFAELDVTDQTAVALGARSPATIDRRLAADRAKLALKGRSHTKPGSLLKDQIPIRTWAQWDDAVPGFVEIDLVGHEGGDALGEHCYTLTVTDIATGWTENRSVRNKARRWVIAAWSRFPTPGHLASWARFAPGIKPSAGKNKGNGSTGKGNRYLARVLGEAAVGAGQTDTFLGARCRRVARRRGKKKTMVAVGRSLLVIIWHLLSDPRGTIQRSRRRPLRPPRLHNRQETQPRPRTRSPRLPRHPRTRRLTVHPNPFPAPFRSAGNYRLPGLRHSRTSDARACRAPSPTGAPRW